MNLSIAYEPRNIDYSDILSESFNKIKKAVDKVSVTMGTFVVDVCGFVIHKYCDTFQNNNDFFDAKELVSSPCDVSEKIEQKDTPFDLILPSSEMNALENRRQMLEESFSKSISAEKECYDIFVQVFQQIENSVQKLDFKGCFVDVSKCEELIDFNLTFDGDLFVSLAKDINSADSNEVMFSISRKKRKIIISQMDIDKLISKIKEVQKIIEDAAKI